MFHVSPPSREVKLSTDFRLSTGDGSPNIGNSVSPKPAALILIVAACRPFRRMSRSRGCVPISRPRIFSSRSSDTVDEREESGRRSKGSNHHCVRRSTAKDTSRYCTDCNQSGSGYDISGIRCSGENGVACRLILASIPTRPRGCQKVNWRTPCS